MPFQKSKTILLASFLLSYSGFANDSKPLSDDTILSKDRLEIFELNREQNKQNSDKLQKDWINAITYKYIHTYGDKNVDSKKSYISINQPIFKSGGIYSAIKYANSLRKYNYLDIDLQKKAMIKDATTLLFNIHKANLSIQKQALQLKNAQIDIIRKKEQVMNGFLDTSFLDNAILTANSAKNSLAELRFAKEELINSFNNLSSQSYRTLKLPELTLVDKEGFLNNNMEIKKSEHDIRTQDRFHEMTVAKYLPTLNFTYDYTKYHEIENSSSYSDGDTVANLGFNITIPLDVRTFNDIESQKINYLKAQTLKNSIILEQSNLFKTKLAKIKMLNEKITIAQEDYKLYDSLLDIINQEKEAEIKTQSDVDTLRNSQKSKALDIKIHKIEQQIELLELYSKLE